MRLNLPIAAATLALITTLAASAGAAKIGDGQNVPPRRGGRIWMPIRITERGHAAAYDGWGDTTASKIFHGALPSPLTDRYAVARTWQGGLRNATEISTFIRNRRTKKVVGEIRWREGEKGVTLIRGGKPDLTFDHNEAALQGFFDDVPGFADAAKTAAETSTMMYESFQTPAYWGPGYGGYQTRYQGTLRTSGTALLYRDPRGRRDHAVRRTDALGPGEHTLELRVGDVIATEGGEPYRYGERSQAFASARANGAIPALTLYKPDRAGTTRLELVLPGGESQVLNLVTK